VSPWNRTALPRGLRFRLKNSPLPGEPVAHPAYDRSAGLPERPSSSKYFTRSSTYDEPRTGGEFRLKSHAADDLARLLPPRRSIHPRPTLGGGPNAGLTRTGLTTKAELLPVNSTLRRGFLEPAIPASPRRGSRRRVDGVRPGATSVRPSRRNWQRSRERHRGFAAALQSPLTDSNRRPPPYHGGFGASRAYTRDHARHGFACKSGGSDGR
jgi:hypothetical protein